MSEKDSINMREFQGQTIGDRYHLEKFLDEGNFGAVYKASHIAYGVELREVAIKIAKRPMTDHEASSAFHDALLMARLADEAPDIVRRHFVMVHDAGRCPEGGALAGHPYVVMELVRGGSLKHSLKSGAFPLTRAIIYFDQILEAMGFMHGGPTRGEGRAPVAHRDLKPGNILVTRKMDSPDVIKVTDFGLAVEVDSLLGWVESGGDLAYLAPESFSHNICSPQSDVYMLGLVFYEMLTGKNPFSVVGTHLRGEDQEKQAELRRLHLSARQMERFSLLESHEEIRPRPALGKVIRTALQVDMASRTYTNAYELLGAWQQAKTETGPKDHSALEHPWSVVRRLTSEAEQCFAVGDPERGDELLRDAMKINRDKNRMPDRMVVGHTYLKKVERLLHLGNVEEASELAVEGYRRRKCRSTCLAMARCYAAQGSPAAASFQRQADDCSDKE